MNVNFNIKFTTVREGKIKPKNTKLDKVAIVMHCKLIARRRDSRSWL